MAYGSKTGGRVKGTPNRNRGEFMRKLEALRLGYDPLIALSEIATDQTVGLNTRIQCHKILARYVHPKPKPVDHITEVSEPVSIEIVSPYWA